MGIQWEIATRISYCFCQQGRYATGENKSNQNIIKQSSYLSFAIQIKVSDLIG